MDNRKYFMESLVKFISDPNVDTFEKAVAFLENNSDLFAVHNIVVVIWIFIQKL